jgi:hypothetical protein
MQAGSLLKLKRYFDLEWVMAVDKNWEDNFDPDAYDDYKQAWVARESLRQENSVVGWIYVGMWTEQNDRAKVGLTTGTLGTRASSSQNPFYTLLCAFKVKDGVSSSKIHEIEQSVIRKLAQHYQRINHVESGRLSEWFYADPHEFRDLIHDFLFEFHSQHMHCYYCSERDVGVIRSWENSRVLGKGYNSPYQALDLSNPPIPFSCRMPPGCGDDCDCWD